MGSIVVAECKCGLNVTISVGGGMRNFRTICYFPCRCGSCNALVEVNLLAKPPVCPDCTSTDVMAYDQPGLIGKKGKQEVVAWSDLLPAGRANLKERSPSNRGE